MESFEPRYKKTVFFVYAKTKTQISFAVTTKLISAFVFATWIVQSLYCLNPKFQASSHLLWLYSLVCVEPCRKPRRPVFSQRGSFEKLFIPYLLYQSTAGLPVYRLSEAYLMTRKHLPSNHYSDVSVIPR